MTALMHIVGLAQPDEVRQFPYGRLEVFRVGGHELGRAVYQPGWRWSEHVGPIAGTMLCEVGHVGLVMTGRAAVRMADGTERVLAEGDFFAIPPGHDSWVVGEQEYASLHLSAAGAYARPASQRTGDVDLEGPSEFMRLVGLRFAELDLRHVSGSLDLGPGHHQPWGLVHGGVFASVIETAATTGAYLTARNQDQLAVGMTNVTDFVRPHRAGPLNVTAEPVHQGRSGQLWTARITRAGDHKLVACGSVRLRHIDDTQPPAGRGRGGTPS